MAAFSAITDKHGQARALREAALLQRDQGELDCSWQSLDASQTIFADLGDAIWTARVLACKATLECLHERDPEPLTRRHKPSAASTESPRRTSPAR
jgi:hypothetical protein